MFSLPGLTPDIPFTHDFPREAIKVRSTFIKTSFSPIFFLPPVFQMELTGILLEDRKASCSPKLDSQSTTLQKTFCDTKCNRWLRRGERIKATILKTKGSHNKLVHIKQQFLESQNPSQGRQDAHTCTYTYTKSPGDHVQNDILVGRHTSIISSLYKLPLFSLTGPRRREGGS